MKNICFALFVIVFVPTSKAVGSEAGMPQLNPEFWTAQIFWLILIFSILYLTIWKIFLPKITYSIENRKSKIVNDLNEAQKLKENAEEKLQITKLAWETAGVRSVKNDIKIKEQFNFKQAAKDLLITSQLRTAIIFNKKVKATNYQIDTYKKKIFIYGIAHTAEERKEVINEAKEILDVEDVIASIFLVEDLRIQKN
jgi:hypothetical protein